jgi:hypothetical protein
MENATRCIERRVAFYFVLTDVASIDNARGWISL